MAKENIQCQLCKNNWLRKRSRGRKPRFCPSCVKNNAVQIMNSENFADELDDSDEVHFIELDDSDEVEPIHNSSNQKLNPKNKIHWICPSCSLELTTYVRLSESPTCNNPSVHTSKRVEMIVYNRKEKEANVYA